MMLKKPLKNTCLILLIHVLIKGINSEITPTTIDVTGCAEAIATLSLHANEPGKKITSTNKFMINEFSQKMEHFITESLKQDF